MAAEDIPPGMQQAYARLQARFIDGLAARWQDACDAREPSRRIDSLHKLAGAAGSFGYEPLGRAARRAEQAIHDQQESEAADAMLALAEQVNALLKRASTTAHPNASCADTKS